jgi:CMP-N-acetylneuraminic acid synthetase
VDCQKDDCCPDCRDAVGEMCEPFYAACAVIVARAGSKGLSRKNGRCLGGIPMLVRAINACQQAGKCVGRVIVTTDDPEFAEMARKAGAQVVPRPEELASDTARIDDSVAHAVRAAYPGKKPEVTLIVQPNIPIWEADTIRGMVERLMEHDCTAVVTVVESKERAEWAQTTDHDGFLRPIALRDTPCPVNRQQLPVSYHLDGQVLALWTEQLMGQYPKTYLGCCGHRKVPWLHKPIYGTDVDSSFDLFMAEKSLEWLGER